MVEEKIVPLISIVIPTHKRSHYAYFAIRSILSFDDDRFELVVSDTSGDNRLFEMISEGEFPLIGDNRLKFIRPLESLDMTGNHNKAISEAIGEYICLIGDDDTITLDAINAAEWASNNNIEIIAPNIVSNYAWPDFRSRFFGSKHASRLYLPKRIGFVKLRKSNDALLSALKNGAQGTDGLPKIYHGIVRRDVLQKIKNISGSYFFGSSPDVSGAIGLALCSESFVVVDYPLTIPGASGGSNTGRSALNKHKGELKNEIQTKSFENEGWSEGVPKFFSVETVWAHAALETIKRIDPEKMQYFNFPKLLALCTILHPEYNSITKVAFSEILKMTKTDKYNLNRNILFASLLYALKKLKYISIRLLRPTAAGNRLFVGELNTIEEAQVILSEHMKAKKWSWSTVLNNFSSKNIYDDFS